METNENKTNAANESSTHKCPSCGVAVSKEGELCKPCAIKQKLSGEKTKTIAGIFAILLGSFGAHKFYLGNKRLGIIYAIFCWSGIPGIIGLIEGIKYLMMTDDDFNQKFNTPTATK